MKFIKVNLNSSVPVYEQIISQVREKILLGTFFKGDALPAIRQLADDLELNHNTVAKSYRYLEKEGLIITAGRKGTFVSDEAIFNIKRSEANNIDSQVYSLINGLKLKGFSRKEILEMVKRHI